VDDNTARGPRNLIVVEDNADEEEKSMYLMSSGTGIQKVSARQNENVFWDQRENRQKHME